MCSKLKEDMVSMNEQIDNPCKEMETIKKENN